VIKITQVQRTTGDVYIRLEYDDDGKTLTVTVAAREIVERMKQVRSLLGRPLTLVDLRQVIVTMMSEIRQGKQPLLEVFLYEDYIGVDLEASS